MATTELELALHEFANLKAEAERVKFELDELGARLVEKFTEADLKSVTVDDALWAYTGTLVTPTRVIVDEERLKKTVGAKVWNVITKKVLDKDKLAAKMAAGVVNPHDVAACSEEKAIKAHIRLTTKKRG